VKALREPSLPPLQLFLFSLYHFTAKFIQPWQQTESNPANN
jgi:hypothetical protein